jgi:hypothetical protein
MLAKFSSETVVNFASPSVILHHRQQFFVNVGNLEPPVLLAWTTLVSILCHIAQGVQGKYIACLLSLPIKTQPFTFAKLVIETVSNFATPVLLALTPYGALTDIGSFQFYATLPKVAKESTWCVLCLSLSLGLLS